MTIHKRCLYINFDAGNNFGGGKYNETILSMLNDMFDIVDTQTFPLEMTRMKNLYNTICGFLNGMDKDIATSILRKIGSEKYDVIFLASSNFGKLAKAIKKRFPDIKICVLFNNIEFNFIKSQLKTSRKPHLLLTLLATYNSEKNITKYANKVIVLNEREKNELSRLYGRQADSIIPITLKDECEDKAIICPDTNSEKKVLKGLFVGSNFYANKHAIEWFSKNVAPQLRNVIIYVVGKGFEIERHLEKDNLKIIGTVDSVSKFYIEADFVIAPIYKGAGMKVKTAEAMMYGRTIIGTQEAFEGYSSIDKYGIVCHNAEEFIKTINERKFHIGFNPSSRKYFKENYEYDSVKEKLFKTIKD